MTFSIVIYLVTYLVMLGDIVHGIHGDIVDDLVDQCTCGDVSDDIYSGISE